MGLRAGGGCKGGCWGLCRVALFSCCLVLGPQPRGKPRETLLGCSMQLADFPIAPYQGML